MPDEPREIGQGCVALGREAWQTVIDALEGNESKLDDAFDVLQRWAPPRWIQAQEERR